MERRVPVYTKFVLIQLMEKINRQFHIIGQRSAVVDETSQCSGIAPPTEKSLRRNFRSEISQPVGTAVVDATLNITWE